MKFQTTLGMIAGIGIAVGIAAATSSGVKAHQFNLSDARVGDGVPKSLTGKPGNAKKGRATAINRKKGNCLACHAMPAPEQADHGDIGPDLGGVADRLSEAEMRLRLIDSKQINEDTIMPSFYPTFPR